ncbi:MAG: DUF3825 domain-containing protein [Candidatus Enterosoma sp.]|nr:DUF3825 domain-containing protein [bacterium]MDY5865666.1 DUF3825 domain-containing protein [Candidatus Enterosoma sp.]
MFTKSQKITIYNLLLDRFKLGQEITYEELSTYLTDNGLIASEFGYDDYISLINDLKEFIEKKKIKNKTIYFIKNYEEKEEKTFFSTQTKKSRLKDKRVISKEKNSLTKLTGHLEVKKQKADENKTTVSDNNSKKIIKFTEEDKKKILSVLKNRYDKNKDYYLSSVTQYLESQGIYYKEYGFSKMKLLLSKIKEVTVTDKMINNIPVSFVRLNGSKEKEKKAPAFNEIYFPNKLILSLLELVSEKYDEKTILQIINTDYLKSIKETSFDFSSYQFNLSIKSKDNQNLIMIIRPSTSKTEYSFFVYYVGKEKSAAVEMLTNYISFINYDKELQNLALLAKKENWLFRNSKDKFIILKIYLQYTFSRLVEEKKIRYSDDKAILAFNTGLVTDTYDDIYLVAHIEDLKQEKYSFDAFTTAGLNIEGKKIVSLFNPLPQRASYYTDANQLLFDAKQDIVSDFDHILLDNISRLPTQFIYETTSNKHIKSICKKIEKIMTSNEKNSLFLTLSNEIKKDFITYSNCKYAIERAINYAIKEASYDYHIPLACYYPSRGVISLLLPLKITSYNRIDCFLLIEKMPSNNYQGQTILTLKQAYTNCRLLSPMVCTYLDCQKIDD